MVLDGIDGLTVTDVVLAETAWVLESHYRVPRLELFHRLVGLLQKANIRTHPLEKEPIIAGLMLCRPSGRVSFADALLWAAARSVLGGSGYTFDQRFTGEGIEVLSSGPLIR